MFWKKRQMAAAPVAVGQTVAAPAGVTPTVTKGEVPLQPKAEKLSGPKEIPDPVGRYLVVDKRRDPDWVWKLKVVVRQSPKGKKVFDVRVFDETQVRQEGVKIKDWTTLDEHPDLILYEGWFDKNSMRAQLEEKKTAQPE